MNEFLKRIRSSCDPACNVESGIRKYVEKAQNQTHFGSFAIAIAVSIPIGVLLGKTYPVGVSNSSVRLIVGTEFPLADTDWGKSERTLVLAFRAGCHYCEDSSEFYRTLARECGARNIRLIAVSPGLVSESQQYLNKLGVTVNEVRPSQLASLGIMRTPTLVLVDKGGIVSHVWLGKLSFVDEQEVLKRLSGDSELTEAVVR